MNTLKIMHFIKSSWNRVVIYCREFRGSVSFRRLFWLFVLGALGGDIVEVLFCYLKYHKWISRSSLLYGPFSVVWGFGFVFLTLALRNLSGKPDRYIFIFGTVLGGAYEYICSVATEVLFGASFWDYSKIPFNINGRVNLLYSFFWGFIAVIWVQIIYPWLKKKTDLIMVCFGRTLSIILCIILIADMGISALALSRAGERQKNIPADTAFEAFLDEQYPNKRIHEVYPFMKFVNK